MQASAISVEKQRSRWSQICYYVAGYGEECALVCAKAETRLKCTGLARVHKCRMRVSETRTCARNGHRPQNSIGG